MKRGIAPNDALVAEILKAAKAEDHILSDAEVMAVVERVNGVGA